MNKTSKHPPIVLLLGSYGQTNLGDDILMYNYLQYLNTFEPLQIYTNVNQTSLVPDLVKKEFNNIQYLKTYQTSFLQWIKIISRVDAIYYGGGTIYKELYKTTGRSPYSVIIRILFFNLISKILGKKIYHLHIGIGTLKTRIGQLITKYSIQLSDFTIFRDQQSYQLASNVLHISENKIAQTTDGLFINPYWKNTNKKYSLPISKHKNKQIIGINLLHDIPDWIDNKQYQKQMITFINQQLDLKNQIVLIPFQTDFNPHHDLKFIKEQILPHIKHSQQVYLAENISLQNVNSLFRQCDMFVGMRLHSLILATANQTPFVAIEYDTKCTRFLSGMDYPYAIKLENLSAQSLTKKIKQLRLNKEMAQSKLRQYSNQNFQISQQCLDQLVSPRE